MKFIFVVCHQNILMTKDVFYQHMFCSVQCNFFPFFKYLSINCQYFGGLLYTVLESGKDQWLLQYSRLSLC
jgi:hypothetical protein